MNDQIVKDINFLNMLIDECLNRGLPITLYNFCTKEPEYRFDCDEPQGLAITTFLME